MPFVDPEDALVGEQTDHAATVDRVLPDGNHAHAALDVHHSDEDTALVLASSQVGPAASPAHVEGGVDAASIIHIPQPRPEPATVGMTLQEAAAFAKLKAFFSSIVKKLALPLLLEVQASLLCPEAEPFTPWRTMRATKRATTTQGAPKVSPTENVLLRTLGLVPADLAVPDADVQELKALFDSPLREQHVRVIATLFGNSLPLSFLESLAIMATGA